jgi:hypothetical protein
MVSSSLLPNSHTTLTDSSRHASALAALPPLEQSNGHDAADEDHASHQTTTAGAAQILFHSGEPERSDESPSRAHDVDEHADAGAVLDHAVNSVSDKNGGDNLITDGGDGDANLRCELVMSFTRRQLEDVLTIGVMFHTP